MFSNILNSIKNAVSRRDSYVVVKASKESLTLIRFLNQNGIIRNFELSKGYIKIFLKFDKFMNSGLNALWVAPRAKPTKIGRCKKQLLWRSFNIPVSLTSLELDKKRKSKVCLGILK